MSDLTPALLRKEIAHLSSEELLEKFALYSSATLRGVVKILFETPLKHYYCILAGLYTLKVRGDLYSSKTMLSALEKLYRLQCPYTTVSKVFRNNCLLILGKLNKIGLAYAECKNISFENFFHVVNYIHVFKDEQVKELLFMQVDHTQLYEYLKIYLTPMNLKFKQVRRKDELEKMQLQITKGQKVFLQKKFEQWQKDTKNYDGVPFEMFMLECIKNYKSTQVKIPKLTTIFEKMAPDKILSAFGEAYPDITVVVQYPYVK